MVAGVVASVIGNHHHAKYRVVLVECITSGFLLRPRSLVLHIVWVTRHNNAITHCILLTNSPQKRTTAPSVKWAAKVTDK